MTTTPSPPVTVETLRRLGWKDYLDADGEYGLALESPVNELGNGLFVCWLYTPGAEWRYDDTGIPTPATEADLLELCRLLGIPTTTNGEG